MHPQKDKDSETMILTVNKLIKQVTTGESVLTILNNLSFSVEQGAAVAVVGTSGSGKSTLLGLLAGLDQPTSGSVCLNGVDLNTLDEDGRAALRAQAVGFVFQSFHLLPAMTAIENVMLPLELAGNSQAKQLAREALDRVGLASRLNHYPQQLSGGEQQRVALARAFVNRPLILFADEPTGNLDAATGQEVIDLLFELNHEQGATLILVTHDAVLSQRCNQVLKLHAGVLQ